VSDRRERTEERSESRRVERSGASECSAAVDASRATDTSTSTSREGVSEYLGAVDIRIKTISSRSVASARLASGPDRHTDHGVTRRGVTDTDTSFAPDVVADADLPARCAAEVVALHEFFEAWLSGRIDRTDDAFARFADALDPGFHIVSPSGEVRDRESITSGVESAHDAHPDGFGIRIENVQTRDHVVAAADHGDGDAGDRCLLTYEEWQTNRGGDGDETARLSTVLFREAPDAPGGVAWRHVHETWLPDAGPGDE
jgi:hypothetical protein